LLSLLSALGSHIQGVLRKEDEKHFTEQINTQTKVNNFYSYFSLPLFDALCKERAEEIKQLNYTSDVQVITPL
jgi:hypothetical protein